MSEKMHVTVSDSNHLQIGLPSLLQKELNIQAGDRLIVDIQDGMLIIMPQPDDYVAHFAGFHKETWEDIDTTAYLEQERNAWQPSSNN
ncbi:MAG: AbrB/MazE/SpoVT family DNA-binding domain-containing protein [Chloroflexota bacterium]